MFNRDLPVDDDDDDKKVSFPCMLFKMLNDAETEGFDDVVSWGSNGIAFRVHKKRDFEKFILPKYFRLKKYSSFSRRLYTYRFQWITKGPDRGGCKYLFFQKKNRIRKKKKNVQKSGRDHTSPFGFFFSSSLPRVYIYIYMKDFNSNFTKSNPNKSSTTLLPKTMKKNINDIHVVKRMR